MKGLTRKQPAPVCTDEDRHIEPSDRREYDAFGPWIYPIRTCDDMPRRFRLWYEELQSSTFLFKVPINAERRAMRPGMDLYRFVLAVDRDRIVLLEWNGSSATRRNIAMDTIQAVRTYQDLLPSDLSLYLADGGIVRLEYNAVSSHEMEKVVDFLRERMIAGRKSSSKPITNPSGGSGNEIRDHFYRGMWEMRARHSPSARILHWEPPGISCRNQGGWGKSSLGCLVLDEGGDMVVINRGQFMRSWHETVYSKADLYIPWTAIRTVELVQKPAGRTRFIPTVRLALTGQSVDIELFAPTTELQQLQAAITAVQATVT
jgi:hypothetical protein